MHDATVRRLPALTDLGLAAAVAVVLVAGTVGAAALQDDRGRDLDVAGFTLVVLASFAALGLRRTAPILALNA